jgi:hypothetical protein
MNNRERGEGARDVHPATELNDAKQLLVRIVSMLSKMCRCRLIRSSTPAWKKPVCPT